MIVAVSDFNFGAMENKGLNIFNTKYVLAKPETATDTDYMQIEAIIAHEYFHNWTGNRVTCRDWFQLSLKEGLTVFRDQEFTSDLHSRAVKRISDVRRLRTTQFLEDAGPLAHPVRPESYVEINNFYTTTVYEKGAEVIRMLHTLIGEDAFQRGLRLYFERHDGQAVTCEDFVLAMEAASGRDLGQFRRWYGQAGTPRLAVDGALRRGRSHLHAERHPVDAADARPVGEKTAAHPARDGVARREWARGAAAARGRGGASRHHARARGQGRAAELPLRRHRRRARAIAAARLLGAGRAEEPGRRGAAALPDGQGRRPLRALGGGPELCPAADAGAGGALSRGAGADVSTRAWPRPSPRRSRTRASSPPSSRRP